MGRKRALYVDDEGEDAPSGAADVVVAAAGARKPREGKGKARKTEPVTEPTTLRVPAGSSVFLLLYPASFDLSRLEGAAFPSALLSGAGGGAVLPLAGGPPVRVAPAPGAGAGLLLAAVARSGGGEQEEEEEGGAAAAGGRVAFVPERISGALQLSIAPTALGGAAALAAALPALRPLALRPRDGVPRRPPARVKRTGF
jgi:hypothetical protein